MTMTRFDRAFKLLRVTEGGYVNHPKDPGGATNMGVTQRTFDWYNDLHKRNRRSVRTITETEVRDIYYKQYWLAVKADDLPHGVAYMVFDAAVNSGPSQAVKWLQRAVGAQADGVVGSETISKARGVNDVNGLIENYSDQRLSFMRSLKHWSTFKNGWTRRVLEVRQQAQAWASVSDTPKPSGSVAVDLPKATGEENVQATVGDMIKDPNVIGAIGGAAAGVSAVASGDGPVQWAIAAAVVIGLAILLFRMVRRRDDEARTDAKGVPS